jgi:2'-5' RNA ligase
LFVLQKRIETAVRAIGLEPDHKNFSPHLTLGRIKDFVQPKNTSQRFDVTSIRSELNSAANEISQIARGIRLYRSRLSSQGAVYTVLHDFHFSE